MNRYRVFCSRSMKPAIALLLALAALVPDRPALAQAIEGRELPVHRIPNIGMAAEFYFSPDGKSIIGTAKRAGDENFHVYTAPISGASTIAARTPAPTFSRTANGSSGPRPATVSTCRRATTPTRSTIRRAPSSTPRIWTAATCAGSPTTASMKPKSRCHPTGSGCCSDARPTERWISGACGPTAAARSRSRAWTAGSPAGRSICRTAAPFCSAPGRRPTRAGAACR